MPSDIIEFPLALQMQRVTHVMSSNFSIPKRNSSLFTKFALAPESRTAIGLARQDGFHSRSA